jgi:multisubunit Na+/H+ antiporter MnhE subunit
MKSFALNLLIAVIWLLLNAEPSVGVFVLGFLLGFVLLALFRGVLGSGDYIRRIYALGRFLLVFASEFLAANLNMVWIVLFRAKESLDPNFMTYDVTGLKPFEILLLSYCISLTPGSTTVEVSDDFKTLVLHTLDVRDAEAVRARLDRVLKRGLLSFTR